MADYLHHDALVNALGKQQSGRGVWDQTRKTWNGREVTSDG
jgi:hypothetical protein